MSIAILASVCVAEPLEEEVNLPTREAKGNLKIEIIRLVLRLLEKWLPLFPHYGTTKFQDFKTGIQTWKDFCIKIIIPKGKN